MSDAASAPRGLVHEYGPRVHVNDDAWTQSALARIGAPDVAHAELLALVRAVYTGLAQSALGHELPRVAVEVPTRMAAAHPRAGVYRGPALDPAARVVVLDVIRAGIVPAQVCFELLTSVLPLKNVRLDHVSLSRRVDAQGRIDGADLGGSRVGGSVAGATLVVPDPMGATGTTLITAVEHLIEEYGRPVRIIALPMIATPEFLRAVLAAFDELVVHTCRVDRGLSPPDVLAARPGALWERERGLDERGYIVPGAGGVGEVLNNSWC